MPTEPCPPALHRAKGGRNRVHLALYIGERGGESARLERLLARRIRWEDVDGHDHVVMVHFDVNESFEVRSPDTQD